MHTEQEISIFASEGIHSSISEAIGSAAASFQKHLTNLNLEARNPVVISVSHDSGHTNYTGYFASIVAVINVDKQTVQ